MSAIYFEPSCYNDVVDIKISDSVFFSLAHLLLGEDAIILAITFTDANNGFFPFGDSDGSVGMKTTTDGGKTWNSESATQVTTSAHTQARAHTRIRHAHSSRPF